MLVKNVWKINKHIILTTYVNILSTVNIEWSRQIVDGLTVNDLDKNAILKAREQFKKRK